MHSQTIFVHAGGHQLECQLYPAHQLNRPTLVFLHEGLGSVAMWRDFPARVAQATGCRSLVYSRYGYGQSDVLEAPFGTDYMHREALQVLPELLADLDIRQPVLVGHSDGASIALIHAGSGNSVAPVAGVIVMAPHCFVEDVSIASIEAAKAAALGTDLLQKLARYHRNATKTFWGWNDIWLHPDFRAWNIESCLPGIRCPILAIQGEDDEYGTLAQIDAIAAQAVNSPDVDLLKLVDCRHSAHKDQPQAVIQAIVDFIEALSNSAG
jgi:pimeloyl-ACP methyl ester carboxylesterase